MIASALSLMELPEIIPIFNRIGLNRCSMDDVALANYIAGCFPGPVEAGRLDRTCANLLKVEPSIPIWFSDYTLQKLRLKHGDINFQHYRQMPAVLLQGFLARGRKSTVLDLWWVGSVNSEMVGFFAALKSTRRGEVFVETFHRISIKEARRLLKRAKIRELLIRSQPMAERFLECGTDHLKSKKKVA